MPGSQRDRMISAIYGAATGDSGWDDAVVALSSAMGCLQGTIEIHDRAAGFSKRFAPLCDPDFRSSHAAYYGRLFSLAGRTDATPVGQPYTTADLGLSSEAFRRSAFYNEWWLPQGTGGATLIANIARSGGATASVTLYKPFGVNAYAERERAIFASAVGHLIRAARINRDLRLVESLSAGAATSPHGFAVVAEDLRILRASEATRQTLRNAGLLQVTGHGDRVRSRDGAIEKLIGMAATRRSDGGQGAADVPIRRPDGSMLWVSVTPCAERNGPNWLGVDRPAALLSTTDPAEQAGRRKERLVKAYGLTHGEAAVALEIARGDGRAAAAKRLGIREGTVRSHLSAIFHKLDIRRQGELARLVSRM